MTERGDEDRERLVKELFERVLDAPAEQRERVLAGAGERDSVQRAVRELLRHESALGDFLESPAGERLLGAADDVRLAVGDRVADFTVIGVLGEGGGGVVYDAEQREPRRRVALKMIRSRTRSEDALRGFREEAANLARLHHGSIAHVYAAGIHEGTGAAQPWIAMERVEEARNIIRHARDAPLSRDDRLRLFLVVCDALHHAHQKGVIHRDVKPGNVLVDSEGRPKVVDFGVACGVEPEDDRASDAVGTLAYASPEQLTAGRGGVDVRADVYGLGALLYELLTDSVPHDVDRLPIAEAARIKREVPVAAPSSRVRDIPPDLDAIVVRAVAPDREARYGSAADLSADVARLLAHEPVSAYAGGSRYQLGKFVRRRRATALAIAGIAAALVAGAAVSLWFAFENAAARDHAERRSYVAAIAAAASALRVHDVAEARRRLDEAPAALRDWEWRHLTSRLDLSSETTAFPGRELYCGAATSDGALGVVSGIDGSVFAGQGVFAALVRRDGTIVRQWMFRADAQRQTVALIRSDGTTVGEWPSDEVSGVPSCAISADGSRMVLGLNSGGVLAYDVAEDRESPVYAAHKARVIAVAFSPDGSRFATAGKDRSARLWNASDRSLVRAFDAHPDRVICLAFDAAGGRLATGGRDGVVRVFDVETGSMIRALAGHTASVEGVSFSPDGARLASASRDRTVRLWDLADGSVVAVGRTHTSNVRDVAFDPRGGAFVSASWDGTLRVWDARTGAEKGVLSGHGSAVTAVVFTPGDPTGGSPLVSFSRDGAVKRWDPDRSDVATYRGLRDVAMSMAFDPAGARLALAGRDGRISIVDSRTARAAQSIGDGRGAVLDVKFLDARRLVLLDSGYQVQIWDVPEDGAPTCGRQFLNPGTLFGAMAVDRGGKAAWITRATGGAVSSMTCIDLGSGAVLETRSSPIQSVVLTCDGRGCLAIGGRDGQVGFSRFDGSWSTAQAGTRMISSLEFDESGGRLVVASWDGTARVLRTDDLSTVLVLSGHSDVVHQAKFVPGGRRIVTVSRDLTTRLWDASTGENVLVLHEHGYPVTCVAVSPDGTRIATGAGAAEDVESTVRIWSAPAAAR